MARVDLHTHSTASDGIKSPDELVSMASAKSLSIISITDHDTLDGISEGAAAAAVMEIEFIPGVELSVNLPHKGLSAHLLGYFPGIEIPALLDSSTPLGEALSFVQTGRSRRNPEILNKLADNGVYIEMEAVELIAKGDVVGRPHIAEAMLNAGYITSMKEAFNRFLAKGKPAYVERDRLPIDRAIEIILESGGLPVMAHPGYIALDREALREFIGKMKKYGLIGIEVFYPTHTASMERMLLEFTREFQLVASGGTDYHGRSNEAVPLGGTDDAFHVDLENVKEFIALCRNNIRR